MNYTLFFLIASIDSISDETSHQLLRPKESRSQSVKYDQARKSNTNSNKQKAFKPGFRRNQQRQISQRPRKAHSVVLSESGKGDAWEANQNLIASLRSENHYLKSQLKKYREELKTVERQCKIQDARLTKVMTKMMFQGKICELKIRRHFSV